MRSNPKGSVTVIWYSQNMKLAHTCELRRRRGSNIQTIHNIQIRMHYCCYSETRFLHWNRPFFFYSLHDFYCRLLYGDVAVPASVELLGILAQDSNKGTGNMPKLAAYTCSG